VCTVVFFLPICLGVLGRLSFPDLAGKEADRILPMVVTLLSGDAMAALVMAAGLAALMSTMDSQLLTLGSIFTRDVVPLATGRQPATGASGRVFVIFLSLCGLALAWRPPDTILQIATQTFTGLAVLFPTVIFGLYLKRVHPLPAILSIVVGEGMVVAFYFQWLPAGGFLPVVWIMLAVFAVYLAAHLALVPGPLGRPAWLANRYLWLLAGVFALAMDFWAWGHSGPTLLGVPAWIGYFVLLSAAQTAIMYFWVKETAD